MDTASPNKAPFPNTTPLPNVELESSDTTAKTEYSYYNEKSEAVHVTRIEYKNRPIIKVFPFSYNEAKGVTKKKVSEIEFRGWSSYDDLPKLLRPGERVSLAHKKISPLMSLLYKRYPNFKKLIVVRSGGTTRFSDTTITFDLKDLEAICKAITKEIRIFETRRKTAALKELSEISTQFESRKTKMSKGALSHLLSHYNEDINLSTADVDAVLNLIAYVPFGNVTVTENFIETRNQINVAYLDNVISRFEALMDVKSNNEKDWQKFFEDYGWILAMVFPYQVILRDREAYVGGKTIENSEGRVVDFLFQNGFKDNYALLEIKTHNSELVSKNPYREPVAYALHKDCSGAISQCLDQKQTFLTDMGQRHQILDPKAVLVIGTKSKLTEPQAIAFELARQNQKNVDIVTFDELLSKLYGLKSILNNK